MEVRNKGLEPLRAFFIPRWIYKALLLNKVSVSDFRNYSKVRSALTVHDMATLLACQQTDIQSKNRLRSILSTGTGAFQMFEKVTSPEENLELMNTALPWSVSEELATSIFNRLSQSNNMTDTLYQFIPFGKTIYVIISEGFQEITENDKQYREFISNYMKACFSVATIQEVTCSSAMRVYIQTLHLG